MKLCFFDIDGTLINTGGAGKSAFEIAIQDAFEVTASCDGIPFSGRTDRAIVSDIFARNSISDSQDNWDRFKSSYLSHLPAALMRSEGTILPGIRGLLELIDSASDVSSGLLTGNILDGARMKLGYYELDHYFSFGGFGDSQPDRDAVARQAMEAAVEYLGGAAHLEQIWVIGDTPLDVRCARTIGASAVAVCTGKHTEVELREEHPDLLLTDLSDPKPLLQQFVG